MDPTTVAVYEDHAPEWKARRPARYLERAESLATDIPPGAIRADLGCGAGGYLAALGRPVVALDAAFAMLELARAAAPDAWCVQGDLEALPIRRGGLAGAWARASYLHVPRTRLPWALAQLHQALRVDAPAQVTMRRGETEGPIPDDDFPGRFFADWDADALTDVFVGAGFAIDELADSPGRPDARRRPGRTEDREWLHVRARRLRTLPDFVGPGMRLLIVGLNPSEYAADVGVGFARPGNRFWPAAVAAGLVRRPGDAGHALHDRGVGMTDLVKRATPGADVLTPDEYRDGARRVERLVAWLGPAAVCFVGLTGWRVARDRDARPGPQPERFGGAPVYVMPNPSGRNAHASLDSLTEHLRAAAGLGERPPVLGP